ncbi:nuclear transport factor 2 family protein [Inquilinus sp. NPDC058860]|uniref:nuclear transport factor 2 family protein n=1 Tax=Inquilinus sp. NPDC058860 TaxID=3346652 RepID=UPI0036C94CF6
MSENLSRASLPKELERMLEHVYREWDRAWSEDDLEAMIALYAPDAVLESPLVAHLLGRPDGVLRGRDRIKALLDKAAPRKPDRRSFHRRGYFTDGRTLVWEYPRATPDGEQMDFFEVMEIEDGLIRQHRVYWGWRGVEIIKADAYHKGGGA